MKIGSSMLFEVMLRVMKARIETIWKKKTTLMVVLYEAQRKGEIG